MHALRFLSIAGAAACFTAIACSGSSGGGGGGPDGAGDDGGGGDGAAADGGIIGTHPSCTGAQTFPADLGESCGAGSNLDLCAVSSTTCSTKACLWDGTAKSGGAPGAAYCTTSCDPATATSCPSGYACKAQGCSEGPPNVCVKLPGATQPTVCDESPKAANGSATNWQLVATSSDGYEYLIGPKPTSAGITAQARKPGGAWAPAGDFATDSAQGISGEGQLDVGGATELATSAGVLRLAGGQMTRELAPAAQEKPLTVFAANGTTRALVVTATAMEVRERDGSGKFAASGTSIPRTDCFIARPLLKTGFVAVCGTSDAYTLYGGTSAADFAPIAMPDGETFGGYTAVTGVLAFGASLDDMLILTHSARVFHRVGTTWYPEGVPQGRVLEAKGSFSDAGFFAASDGTQYVVQEMSTGQGNSFKLSTFALRGGCWASDPIFGGEQYVPLPGGGFVYAIQNQVCSTK